MSYNKGRRKKTLVFLVDSPLRRAGGGKGLSTKDFFLKFVVVFLTTKPGMGGG